MTTEKKAVDSGFRCGLVALVGRPNVGKSTLLNALIGMHLSIVSPRPQTTRHRILGVSTHAEGQILYVDTPGMHRGGKRAMNRSLNRAARAAIAEVDVAVQVVEMGRWTDEDRVVHEVLAEHRVPSLLAVNKTDRHKDKRTLLPFVADITAKHAFDEVFYLSALKRDGLEDLENGLIRHLPTQDAIYAPDEVTNRSERFLVAELVREQLMLRLDQELPYATTVVIEQFEQREDGMVEIHAVIWVEREGQKPIVIGRGGERLKAIGSGARRRIEQLLEKRVYLRLWVKVREGWVDDESALKRFGYTD